MPKSIVLNPPPVDFIKSISEQGYSLSTAIADLIDNSISAGSTRIEILIDPENNPLKLFIADNGSGMTATQLTRNMRFPSSDMDEERNKKDLGRFGLGLKTASFSQSRKFTIISKQKESAYEGRTWDIEYLKKTKKWSLIIESKEHIDACMQEFEYASSNFHQRSLDFKFNTLVIWEDLYKLKKLTVKSEINREIAELRSHIGLVFHRFIDFQKLQIRLNNTLIEAFEPFPKDLSGVQLFPETYWRTSVSTVGFQALILPKSSTTDLHNAKSLWTPYGKTLDELQGIYVYRNERLINYGGWLRTIPKSTYLQLGRVRVDISNNNDSDFHLNVAKSSLTLPFALKKAMVERIKQVASQAIKEYRERTSSSIIRRSSMPEIKSLLIREINSEGIILKINKEFNVLKTLCNGLSAEKSDLLKVLLSLIEGKFNEIWNGESGYTYTETHLTSEKKDQIQKVKSYYEKEKFEWIDTKESLLDNFGRNDEIAKFIDSLNY